MKSTSLKKNFVYQFIYRILTVITPLITSPYLSRVLGAENLGIFSATYAYVNYFLLFAMLGVENYGNRTISIYADDEVELEKKFWSIYSVQLIASAMSIIIYYSSLLFIGEKRLYIALLQGLWIASAMLDINWFFFGCQQFKLTVTRNIFIKLLTILGIFVYVRSEEDLLNYVFITAFGSVISQLIMWYFIIKTIRFKKPCWSEIKIHIKPILKLFIPVMAFSIFHIMDKTMVDLLSDEINGGCYYNVDRLVNIPLGLITGLSTVMLPRISKMLYVETIGKVQELLEKSAELTVFLSSAIAFGLGAIANEFVPIFFGQGYDLCVSLILNFVPIIIIKALSDFLRQQYLIPSKNDIIYIIAVCCGAVSNLIANYLLISKKGALGAVFGTFIAESIVLLIEIIGIKKEMNFFSVFIKNVAYIVFGIIMFIIVRLSANLCFLEGVYALIFLVFIGIGSYMMCSLIYWCRNKGSIFHIYVDLIKTKIISLKK